MGRDLIINSFSTTTGGGVLFQAGALFYTENAKFWPILAILLRICALFGVHIAVVASKILLSFSQGTINCTILGSGIGGSGDPRRKWESEREREREKRKVLLLFAK